MKYNEPDDDDSLAALARPGMQRLIRICKSFPDEVVGVLCDELIAQASLQGFIDDELFGPPLRLTTDAGTR